MKIYPQLKKISNICLKMQYQNCKLQSFVDKLPNDFNQYGIDFKSAKLISGLKVKDGKLYGKGFTAENVNDLFYIDKHRDIKDGEYWGHIYFKTRLPHKFVRVYFQTQGDSQ